MVNNKGKDSMNRNKNRNNRKNTKPVRTGKATAADIQKLKEHFDKKFGRG